MLRSLYCQMGLQTQCSMLLFYLGIIRIIPSNRRASLVHLPALHQIKCVPPNAMEGGIFPPLLRFGVSEELPSLQFVNNLGEEKRLTQQLTPLLNCFVLALPYIFVQWVLGNLYIFRVVIRKFCNEGQVLHVRFALRPFKQGIPDVIRGLVAHF